MRPKPSFVQSRQHKEQALASVAARIASCEVCPELCKSALNPVPGEGNPEAALMFVGEAPGAQEDREGRPFIGASGKFLVEMLGTIGLSREDVFITSIVKYRPPQNRDPTPSEIENSIPYLLEQIRIIQPKIVVFLGRHSMSVFFKGLKISEVHGEALEGSYTFEGTEYPQVFLPLYHPAAALYNGSMRATLLEDFAKIPALLSTLT